MLHEVKCSKYFTLNYCLRLMGKLQWTINPLEQAESVTTNSKVPTVSAFVCVSIGRRHKLLMTACLRVAVAFLWFRQCSLGRQIAGNVCRQIKLLCKETSVTLKLRQLKSTFRRQFYKYVPLWHCPGKRYGLGTPIALHTSLSIIFLKLMFFSEFHFRSMTWFTPRITSRGLGVSGYQKKKQKTKH